MGEAIGVLCNHGYVLEQETCPGCYQGKETPHGADLVVVALRGSARLGKRCRLCGGTARDPQHVTVRSKRKTRPAKNTAQQGARFEREVMAELEGHGYTCMRSAASKGAVDIVAVPDRPVLPVLWIQCKLSDPVIPPAERRSVLDIAHRANGMPLVAYRVDGRTEFRELTGPGPAEWKYWFPRWCPCGKPDCPQNAQTS